jgi:hypothetical protein
MSAHKTVNTHGGARRVVVPHAPSAAPHKPLVKLSGIWRRDADAIRRRAVKMERAAAKGIMEGWAIAKPRLHRLEHRLEDGVKASWRSVRPKVVHLEHEMGANLLAFYRRMRPAAHE